MSVSERSDTDDSVFMIWTVPTSLLAAAGLFYTLAAVAIVGYKYTMFISQGDANQVRRYHLGQGGQGASQCSEQQK